ncbi:hypothetical protein EVAR_60134_1 [Eumeta japonica]|uniref:Uncharacterized protein n=1 Tax=Eumeta variegata TaxID=151549 RepID=A0A4C2A6G4_EUMVA|nr:hypothetical protein EVAR_60134_1 [Eumeta japonica]
MSNRDRVVCANSSARLGALATDAGELYVLRHDGDAFGVYRAQIRIFEETDQVRLASLLEAITAELWNRSDGSREGRQFPACSGEASSRRRWPVRFAGGLRRELFTWRLPPVDLRAVCFVRAMTDYLYTIRAIRSTHKYHTNPRLLLTALRVEVKRCDTIGYRGLYGISEPFDFDCEIVRRIGDNIPWPTDKVIGRWRLVGGCC